MSPKQTSRTVEVGPHEALFIDARRYATTEEYRDDRRKRLLVERQISRMAWLGARFARFFGQTKVRARRRRGQPHPPRSHPRGTSRSRPLTSASTVPRCSLRAARARVRLEPLLLP